jgi:sugar lactone lactonase YvrE
VHPLRGVEGGRVTIHGSGIPVEHLTSANIGAISVPISFASSSRLIVTIPQGLEGGHHPISIPGMPGLSPVVEVGARWATGLHQVDSPVFDAEGNLFVTYSGSRGQEAPVSVFRVTREGAREAFASGIVNATSMAIGPDGHLYVSSRFEGSVYRVLSDGAAEQVASELGVACGIAFDAEGTMYVGDRSGTIFAVRDGRPAPFATIPASVAAFHLASGPEQDLFVTAPTLNAYDSIYRIDRNGEVSALPYSLGRPQGLGFHPDGTLHVVDALAGASGVYRFAALDRRPELVIAGASLVGVAFGPGGEMAVTSNATAFRFD